MVSYKACLKHVHCIFLVYFQQLANSRWSHSGLRRPIPLIGKRALLPDPTLVGKTTLNHPMVLKRSSSDNELFMRTMRAYEPGTKSNARFIVQSSNSSSVLGIVWVLPSLLPKQASSTLLSSAVYFHIRHCSITHPAAFQWRSYHRREEKF